VIYNINIVYPFYGYSQDRGVYKHAGIESKGASAQGLRVFFC
jgi:hypothetical protein